MKKTFILATACLTAMGFLPVDHSLAQAAAPSAVPPSKVDPAALKRWQDARFGLMITWGPVSQKGTEISWTRGGAWKFGGPVVSIEEYDNLYKTFDPEKFNAD